MALTRTELAALLAAGGLAIAVPVALLPEWQAPVPVKPAPRIAPLQPGAAAGLAAIYERPLFANGEAEAPPADAPQLLGVVGRLGGDAVALVRGGDGATRTLRIGESVDGWELVSLAIDAAFFTRGAQRVRVPLPVGQ